MNLLRKNEEGPVTTWRQCIECGNRFRVRSEHSRPSWCSIKCENASLRRQRDQIESTWIRATWFLR